MGEFSLSLCGYQAGSNGTDTHQVVMETSPWPVMLRGTTGEEQRGERQTHWNQRGRRRPDGEEGGVVIGLTDLHSHL